MGLAFPLFLRYVYTTYLVVLYITAEARFSYRRDEILARFDRFFPSYLNAGERRTVEPTTACCTGGQKRSRDRPTFLTNRWIIQKTSLLSPSAPGSLSFHSVCIYTDCTHAYAEMHNNPAVYACIQRPASSCSTILS